MGLYSKLRKIGHGRVESLRRSFWHHVERNMPFPSFDPIEIQIEEQLSSLEDYLKPRKYSPQPKQEIDSLPGIDIPTHPSTEQDRIDFLVGYLNGQLNYEKRLNEKRFSETQRTRYETVLEQLAERYPSKE